MYNEYAMDSNALKVKDGNLRAFDEIDREIRPVVRRMSFKYNLNEFDRDDLIQEMMFNALILCMKYDYTKGHYRHYVLRSTRLKMYNAFNDFRSWREIELKSDERSMTEHKHALSHLLIKEVQSEYIGAVENLSSYERHVLKLIFDEWTFQDIASAFKKDTESIINTLYRIKIKLDEVEDLHGNVDNDASSGYSILELK